MLLPAVWLLPYLSDGCLLDLAEAVARVGSGEGVSDAEPDVSLEHVAALLPVQSSDGQRALRVAALRRTLEASRGSVGRLHPQGEGDVGW